MLSTLNCYTDYACQKANKNILWKRCSSKVPRLVLHCTLTFVYTLLTLKYNKLMLSIGSSNWKDFLLWHSSSCVDPVLNFFAKSSHRCFQSLPTGATDSYQRSASPANVEQNQAHFASSAMPYECILSLLCNKFSTSSSSLTMRLGTWHVGS